MFSVDITSTTPQHHLVLDDLDAPLSSYNHGSTIPSQHTPDVSAEVGDVDNFLVERLDISVEVDVSDLSVQASTLVVQQHSSSQMF
ncbi:hypothetical protein HAX54_015362 [Datura stramonium]|uniref:Uncharacterized protein n=1 Tax=Datura stramonium TaxID=4076 RepID=A0ABS8S026_DATST|nr:hypothetical protein [Datura stramonium]